MFTDQYAGSESPSRFRRKIQVFAGYKRMENVAIGVGSVCIVVQDLQRLFVEFKRNPAESQILSMYRIFQCSESYMGGKQDNLHHRRPCMRQISGDRRTLANA